MPKNLKFKKITNKFIETGSYLGDGIQLAIESGFDEIFSIEVSDKHVKLCQNRFQNYDNVKILKGDSMYELPKLLEEYKNEKFTYWLDGHYSDGDTGKGDKDFPIINELESILKRSVTGEIIYVDDMRILRNLNSEVNLENIISVIKKYKNNFKISYEDSTLHSGDLVIDDIMIIEY
jgi:hypothetical protein